MDEALWARLQAMRLEYVAKAPQRRQGYFVAFCKPQGEAWRLELGSETREEVMRIIQGWQERRPHVRMEWVVVGPEAGDGAK